MLPLIFCLGSLIYPLTHAKARHLAHHLDLEMSGQEYLQLLEARPGLKTKSSRTAEDLEIERYLAVGKRNLQWVDFVNALRPADRKLSLSSPATQGGYPVNQPRIYNFKVIKEKWQILESLLPKPLKKVIFEGAPFTTDLGVSDREFIEWLLQVDLSYQLTSRYKMLLPFKEDYRASAAYDVRGYLQLKEEEELDEKLQNFENLSDLKQSALKKSLLMICLNSEKTREACKMELREAMKTNSLPAFKDLYFSSGKKQYESFFTILGARPDGVWTSADPMNFHIPFANPHNEAVMEYLKVNIEDEWRWNGWQLNLNFVDSDDESMTHIVWEPGTTPHVDNAPGTIITMDANSLLTEYDVQWTIRHEYGHVLGLPDCYHEFYDEELEAFVSYQLDVTNLMCSRRGHLKEIHYTELKKAYFKE